MLLLLTLSLVTSAAHDDGIPGHGGVTMAQVYTGQKTHLTKVYPMQRKSQMPSTLLDCIRDIGAFTTLFSDDAKEEQSQKVQTILRHFCIKDHQSEPYNQQQNPAERGIRDLKEVTTRLMDRTGTPDQVLATVSCCL